MTEARRVNKKKSILDELANSANVETACQKVGLPRSTYYRWRKADKKFADKIESAIDQGIDRVNDFVESMLLGRIRNGDLTAMKYWLDHNHPRYMTKKGVEQSLGGDDGPRSIPLLYGIEPLDPDSIAEEVIDLAERCEQEEAQVLPAGSIDIGGTGYGPE